MRLVLALCALLFALPASATTLQFQATTTGFTDFITDFEDPGAPPHQRFESGTFGLTVTLIDEEQYFCDLDGFNCRYTDSSYRIVDGVFQGVASDPSSESRLTFSEGTGFLSINDPFTNPQNFRITEFALTQVPLPPTLILYLTLLLLGCRFCWSSRRSA